MYANCRLDSGIYLFRFKIINGFLILFILVVIGYPIVFASNSYGPSFFITIENPVEESILTANTAMLNFTINNNYNSVQLNSVEISSYLDGEFYNHPQLEPGLGEYWVSGAHGGLILTNLTEGKHSVEIRVKITGFLLGEGNYEKNLDPAISHFSIASSQPSGQNTKEPILPSNFAIIAGAAIAATIICAICLLLFYKKIKPSKPVNSSTKNLVILNNFLQA
jgi:hypothetical protein